ncbi:hypothetical protein GS597_08450 [Synechococcales cyanobacterium C]|uniref:Uncharacterized protein n=1 Tax=Petrachloros mirabilis ULC683 TaxID=2781853 RepID=A0A8K1ZYL3_9CYAN|nr:hypothetical protein [Petrachloros mirabilis]NCJ06537.1 hypothetical protein [Petrachloros mirabilis ULC683]
MNAPFLQPRLVKQMLLRCRQLRTQQQESGYIVVVTAGLSLALLGLLSAYALLAKVEDTSARASTDSQSGFYAAEAGLNRRAQELRENFQFGNRPVGTSPSSIDACLGSNSQAQGSGDFGCQRYAFTGARPGQIPHSATTYVVPRNNGEPLLTGRVPPGEQFQNLHMIEYGYSLYSVGQKDVEGQPQTEAVLEMDIRSREIPMFQFAAFYRDDLELWPGPPMVLTGPVHSNSSIFFGANERLDVNSQITAAGQFFLKRKYDNSTTPGSNRVSAANPVGALIDLWQAIGNPNTAPLQESVLKQTWGTQIQLGIDPVELPTVNALDKSGQYYNLADIRVEYKPGQTIPFAIWSNDRSSNKDLSDDELKSLRQPVLISKAMADAGLCDAAVGTVPVTLAGLTTQQRTAVVNALQAAILQDSNTIAFSTLGTALNQPPHNASGGLRARFVTNLQSQSLLSAVLTTLLTTISNQSPHNLAALTGQCFVAPPVQNVTTFFNNREGRQMQLLQMNIKGFTLWNHDGRYLDGSGQLVSAKERLFKQAAADSNAPTGSFQRLGLSGIDGKDGTSQGGFVMHARVADNTANANGNQSPYGFVLTGGSQLFGLARSTNISDPTGLTVASDQAIYVQGNYNSVNKQPAALLGDSMNVLSNSCLNSDFVVNCGVQNSSPNASDATTILNAGLLGGTDITRTGQSGQTGYNGGLENYPRFHETWGSNRILRYRGSFVSLGQPNRVRGRWIDQRYAAPRRDWEYDTDFNDARDLPPLTPKFVFLRQETFVRKFD